MPDPKITEYSCLTHTLGTIGGTNEQWERWNWLYKEVISPLRDGARGGAGRPPAGAGVLGCEAQVKRKRQAGAETGRKS